MGRWFKSGQALLVLLVASTVVGLSSSQNSNVFRIVGIPGAGTELLPVSYVRSLSRWTIDDGSPAPAFDSSSVVVRPTLEFLIRGGVPTYALVGMQNPQTPDVAGPDLAQQWIAFALTAEPNFRVLLYHGLGDGTDERVLLVDNSRVQKILESLGNLLVSEQAEKLSDGFHVVSFPLSWVEISNGADICEEGSMLSCIATAEPDGRELLSLDQNLLEMTVTSILQAPMSEFHSVQKGKQ